MSWRLIFCRSNPISPDPRVEKEAACLAKAGFHVTILGWDRSGELPTTFEYKTISGYRLPIKAEFGKGVGNLPALLRWQRGLFAWLAKHRNEFDFIHACDFDTLIPAILCKLFWNKKVVYDVFDFYAAHLRATPAFIKAIIRWVDLKLISHCDAVILADEARFQQIRSARLRHHAVIYNTPVDSYNPNTTPSNSLDGTQLRLTYIGLLQIERGLLEMLEVIAKHPEWHLDLAGFGGDESRILHTANQLDNVTFHGRVSYQDALSLSERADVLFATYDPHIENHKYASPNKVFEAMMLAKPVIVASGTNMDRLVEERECGVVIQYGSTMELDQALTNLARDVAWREKLGQNGRRAYEHFYHWDIMQQRLLNLYNTLTQASAGA